MSTPGDAMRTADCAESPVRFHLSNKYPGSVDQQAAPEKMGGSVKPMEFPSVEQLEMAATERKDRPSGLPPMAPSVPLGSHSLRSLRHEEPTKDVVSLENFEHVPRIRGVLNSPRSLKACEMEGISPAELLQRNITDFMGPGVPEENARMRYFCFEKRRKERLERVYQNRSVLVAEDMKAEGQRRPQDAAMEPKKNTGDTSETRGASVNMLNQFGQTSRSSSGPWRHGYSHSRASASNHGMRSLSRPGSRSASVGAMMIRSRAMSEHRPPSSMEIAMLERIEEREQRTSEARQRMEEEEERREQECILKQLKKMKTCMNNIIEKEAKRNAEIYSRRLKWDEQMRKIQEQQRKEERKREFKREEYERHMSAPQGYGASRSSIMGGSDKGRQPSVNSVRDRS